MSYPASIQTTHDAFASINNTAIRIKQRVIAVRNASAAGPIPRQEVLNLQLDLDRASDVFTAPKPAGLVQYTKDQFNDQTLDVVAEFTTMNNAAIQLRDWIFNNFPRDAGSGAVLAATVDQDGNRVELTFSTAQLATFRTHCDTFVATIS